MSEKIEGDADGEPLPPSLLEVIKLRKSLDSAGVGSARFLLLVADQDTGDLLQYQEYEIKGRFRWLWEQAIEQVRKDHQVDLVREAGGAVYRSEHKAYVLLFLRPPT